MPSPLTIVKKAGNLVMYFDNDKYDVIDYDRPYEAQPEPVVTREQANRLFLDMFLEKNYE
jgi:hypothetical protein